jgi:hypothetical protein
VRRDGGLVSLVSSPLPSLRVAFDSNWGVSRRTGSCAWYECCAEQYGDGAVTVAGCVADQPCTCVCAETDKMRDHARMEGQLASFFLYAVCRELTGGGSRFYDMSWSIRGRCSELSS